MPVFAFPRGSVKCVKCDRAISSNQPFVPIGQIQLEMIPDIVSGKKRREKVFVVLGGTHLECPPDGEDG